MIIFNYLLILLILVLAGCTKTPEINTKQESIAHQILKNQNEAKKAQEEYIKLQHQRTQNSS